MFGLYVPVAAAVQHPSSAAETTQRCNRLLIQMLACVGQSAIACCRIRQDLYLQLSVEDLKQ